MLLKCENFQNVGAFKFRGAWNAINCLSDAEREAGILTHSSGNHGQAVARVCQILGIEAVVVMPYNSYELDFFEDYSKETGGTEPTPEPEPAPKPKAAKYVAPTPSTRGGQDKGQPTYSRADISQFYKDLAHGKLAHLSPEEIKKREKDFYNAMSVGRVTD